MKVFLDANVLLDGLLHREGKEDVWRIMELADEGYLKLYTSTIAIHICAYFMKKEGGIANTKKALRALMEGMDVLSITAMHINMVLSSPIKHLEDGFHYFTALDSKLNYFISRDIKFRNEAAGYSLPVISPKQFLKKITTL